MNRYGDPVLGDEAAHDRRYEAALNRYEEREANAPSDLYQDEAERMIMEALTGGKDDIDITGCLVERFRKDCGNVNALVVEGVNDLGMVFADPDHLTRLVQWTVQDCIKKWVDFQTKKYAEDVL